MKAIVYHKYGAPEVMRLEDVPSPKFSEKDNSRVLVRVQYVSINPMDVFYRQGFLPIRLFKGLLKPQSPFLGSDFSGTVVEVGSQVKNFRVGDRVFGVGLHSNAEFVLAREERLCKIPELIDSAQAAAVPLVGLTALDGVRDVAKVKAGQRVLVYGASGGIGHMAVQLAKHLGAHVTAVCSTGNLAWVGALGADVVMDYAKQDFAKTGIQYDFVYDTVGKRTYWNSKPALKENGIFLGENPFKARFALPQMLLAMATRDENFRSHLLETKSENLEYLAGLMAAEKLKPHIEKIYPFEQMVAAHRHVETGRTKGKILVAIAPDSIGL
jgi:NADPH:quinone reductase-like Zn-dependent oxidoreductase